MIWVEIRARGHTFLLCNVYRPPGTDQTFWQRFRHAIELGYQVNQSVVILGDMNCDLLGPENNKLKETMNIYNLTNVIDKPTRVTDRSRTLLDPILISDTLSAPYSDVLSVPNTISDHDAAVAFLECPREGFRSFQREVWIYDRADTTKFTEKIENMNWDDLFLDKNIDDMCNIFTSSVIDIAKECIPSKLVTIRGNDKPWFTSQLRKEIRIRDRLRKRVLKNKREADIAKYKKTTQQSK